MKIGSCIKQKMNKIISLLRKINNKLIMQIQRC